MQKIKMGIMATFALLGASVLAIPTEGLVFRLDASDRAHILENADGYVTNWLSSACDPAYAATHGRIGFIKTPDYPCPQNGNDGTLSHGEWPFLNAAAYGGRGAMRFGFDKDGTTDRYSTLRSDTYTTNRTVVLVFQWTKYKSDRYTGGFVLWGMWGKDFGVGTVATGSQKMWLQNTAVTMGGNIWLNGGRLSDPTHTTLNENLYQWSDNLNKPIVLITECTEEIAAALGRKQGGLTGMYTELCLGSHATYTTTGGNVYSWIDVAEFISYDRVLTAAERAEIEDEMERKWVQDDRWTGNGAAGVWSDGDNWMTGSAPELGRQTALFETAAALDFSADATLAAIRGGVTVNVSNGALLQMGDVDLAGRDLVINGDGRIIGTAVTNTAARAAKVVLNATAGKKLVFDAAVAANIALVQAGEGTGEVSAGQRGAVVLEAGVLSVCSNLAPAAISGLSLHLDASDADTLTVDADGYVRSWRSKSSNGIVFAPNPDPSASMPPILTDMVVGKAVATPLSVPGVRFGAAPGDALTTGAGTTKSSLRGDRPIAHGTVFAVCETLHRVTGNSPPTFYCESGNRNVLGLLAGSFGKWNAGGLVSGGRAWVNGLKSYDGNEGDDAFILYQNSEPDKYQRYHQVTFELAEGYATPDFTPVLGGEGDYSINGTLCEMIVYDRRLTEAERQSVERYLLDKWMIHEQPGVMLPPVSPLAGDFAVTGDAAVDLNGMSQAVTRLVFDSGVNAAYPVLTLASGTAFDVREADLVLNGDPKAAGQTLIAHGVAGLTGPFKSVAGLAEDRKIAYRPTEAILKVIGGLMLIFR